MIPWCLDVVSVGLYVHPVDGPQWYYGLDPSTALYPTATGGDALGIGGGDACLISQSTSTVGVGGDVKTQTVEIFYIWNDPIFVR